MLADATILMQIKVASNMTVNGGDTAVVPRGVRDTVAVLPRNSAKTLEDVLRHYDAFFDFVTGGGIRLTARDQRDIVAYLKLLD